MLICLYSRGAETTSLLHTHVDVLPMNHESLLDTHLDDSNDDEPTNDSKRKMDQRRLSSSKKRRTESIENAEDR
jgi:hypothetical protein